MVSKLAAFFERYPDIAVEFGTSESPTSLIEDGFDLAIHSGDLSDSSLVARRFAQTLTILTAESSSSGASVFLPHFPSDESRGTRKVVGKVRRVALVGGLALGAMLAMPTEAHAGLLGIMSRDTNVLCKNADSQMAFGV
jgi:DNA-binding transcriptional LysR family regulator